MLDPVTSVMHSAHRDGSLTQTEIIPGKISIVPPQIPTIGRRKTPEAPPLLGILSIDKRNRTRYKYEMVIRECAMEKKIG